MVRGPTEYMIRGPTATLEVGAGCSDEGCCFRGLLCPRLYRRHYQGPLGASKGRENEEEKGPIMCGPGHRPAICSFQPQYVPAK